MTRFQVTNRKPERLEYRTLVFHNASTTNEAKNVHVHFDTNYDSGNQSALTPGISVDLAGDIGITTSAAVNVNPPTHLAGSAPSGIGSWNTGTTRALGLDLGDIPAGQFRAIALRRVITPGASAQDNAEFQLKITADTGE